MKRILCARFPAWPIDREKRRQRRRGLPPDGPFVIVQTAANRREIVAASDAAQSTGIRPGMTLAQARALCAAVACVEHEPHRDAVALEALARWMMRFSPTVMPVASDGCIFLDLSGCERVFHGFEPLLHAVRSALNRFRVTARLAVAPNPGAAWALTFSSTDRIIESLDLETALDPLPLAALRLEEECNAALYHLGLTTIGALRALPRHLLPSRFGPLLLWRLDQALGRVAEPLIPLIPFTPVEAAWDFDGVVEDLEAVWVVFKKLLMLVTAELIRRGQGVRELHVEFTRPYTQILRQTIRLSRPSRDPANLFNLLRCAMETMETEVGFLGIRLCAAVTERLTEEQIHMHDGERHAAESDLNYLIERLRIRLGDEGVVQATLIESHVPEKAWRPKTGNDSVAAPPPPRLRPLHLIEPTEVRVMAEPIDDTEALPRQFTCDGHVHAVKHIVGPERICGRWWEGHHKTRDYYDVEDQSGRRFWLFRVLENRRWFLHGEFA